MEQLQYGRLRKLVVAIVTGALVVPALWTIASVPAAQAAKRCTRTVTGAHTGALNVGSGERLCLKRATQDGDITVASNGSLKVVRSTVDGAVTLQSGFAKFKFCKSQTVSGAISATGGNDALKIGGPKCKGNIIDGALTLTSNNAGLRVDRSHIVGAVTVSATLGRSTISGNRITGALTCTTNNPEPSNGGNDNTVTGARSGQTCAADTF